jgi:hypothetical protein
MRSTLPQITLGLSNQGRWDVGRAALRRDENSYRNTFRKPELKRPIGRTRLKWGGTVKMGLDLISYCLEISYIYYLEFHGILRKQHISLWTGFMSHRLGTSGRLV